MSAKKLTPDYQYLQNSSFGWDLSSNAIMSEYRHCVEEGKDVEKYKGLFEAVNQLPADENKERISDVIFEMMYEMPIREDYAYVEPSDLEGIRACRPAKRPGFGKPDNEKLKKQLLGAWLGRTCGCMLGKTVEGIKTPDLTYVLKSTDNYPMHRYILSTDITEEIQANCKFNFRWRCFADKLDGCAPVDDDTNYTVLGKVIIDKYGVDFTPKNVADAWVEFQSKNAYCTAERVAFRNFVTGYYPPVSAVYKNPYREWIGAQIRADYFGYINPGNPELAADMAWRDASISHVKNGIYGEMFVAAMLAAAAVCDDMVEIIEAGLGQIPEKCRLTERIRELLDMYANGASKDEEFKRIHELYDEFDGHDWCHTISNAMIVVASLLWGKGDYSESICMSVETGFDTDCNGATVGSILGMRDTDATVDEKWTAPINGRLATSIFGVGTVELADMAEKTYKVATRE